MLGKRAKERRHKPTDSETLPTGDLGYFFGAAAAPHFGDLAALLVGPAFMAQALAGKGAETSILCGIFGYEASRLTEMEIHRARADAGRADSHAFIEQKLPLHEAVAGVVAALGGATDSYAQLAAGQQAPAGPPVWPDGWVGMMHAPHRWARGESD